MIELKSLKKLSILLIFLQSISFSTLSAQNESPLNIQEKLDSLKTSLNEVTIMELGGMVKISQEIKGFENDKFLSLDEFQSVFKIKSINIFHETFGILKQLKKWVFKELLMFNFYWEKMVELES